MDGRGVPEEIREELSMNKYHNRKSGGFDSQKEKGRYAELLLMQRAGMISGLKRQVRFELIPSQPRKGMKPEQAAVYIADFVYYQNGEQIVEDVKGYRKGEAYRLFVLKRKLMLWVHGIQIKET